MHLPNFPSFYILHIEEKAGQSSSPERFNGYGLTKRPVGI